MKFLILNGPNINMLGIREPELYGTLTYAGLVEYIAQQAAALGVEVEFYQSNSEGDLVTAIQNAYGRLDGIVLNPAAYTHTSVAILDALKAVSLPAAEVHISDVTQREAFRQVSYAGMACRYHFVGEGKEGYLHALETLKRDLEGSLVILHAMPRAQWERDRAAGVVGRGQMEQGPFIHCSPVEYFWRVAAGRYTDGGYVLLCIDPRRLDAPLKWEDGPHNPGRYYPHIYGAFTASAVTAVLPLHLDAQGNFVKNPELSGYADR